MGNANVVWTRCSDSSVRILTPINNGYQVLAGVVAQQMAVGNDGVGWVLNNHAVTKYASAFLTNEGSGAAYAGVLYPIAGSANAITAGDEFNTYMVGTASTSGSYLYFFPPYTTAVTKTVQGYTYCTDYPYPGPTCATIFGANSNAQHTLTANVQAFG